MHFLPESKSIRLPEALRGRRGVVLLSLVLLSAALVVGYRSTIPKVETYAVTREDVVQTVVASGRVETPHRIAIGSQTTGTIAAIPVEEGQAVKAGQLLISLENSEALAAVAQAQAAAVQAETRLRQLREVGLPTAEQGLRQAEANLRNAQNQYERTRTLRARGFIGQAQLDDAQRNLDTAESQLRVAELQVKTNSPQGSDYMLAEAALNQAQANLAAAQARLAYTSIRSPSDGTLISRDAEPGDVVQPGKTLMTLSPAGQTQLVLQIDEKNLSLLRVGQKAIASADAYPDRNFSAVLAYINPAVDPQRGSVEVKLDVPQPPAYLRQDMTVSVDIETARHANVVTAPFSAIHDSSSASPWIYKDSKGRAVRQPVTLGLRGADRVEILSGIQPGDLLIPASTAKVTAGKRVRSTSGRAGATPRP